LDSYLNYTGGPTVQYDVIQGNWGLHDLVNCNNTAECKEHVDIPTYAANIVEIFTRLQPYAKNLVFATTTPVPNVTTSLGRTYEAAVQYNAAAKAALQTAFGSKVSITDLWQTVIDQCGAYYTNCSLQIPVNVHFEPLGQQVLGQAVSDAILKILGM
jgi:hypothetical protein